jgi:hypothetical protein
MDDGIYRAARELIAASEREKEMIKARMAQEKKERHRDAVARYSRTPKGSSNNSRKCRKYAEKHREEMKAYNREWQDNFRKAHGVCYSTYRARLRREQLLDGL